MTERQLLNWAVRYALAKPTRKARKWPLIALCRLLEARYLLTGKLPS